MSDDCSILEQWVPQIPCCSISKNTTNMLCSPSNGRVVSLNFIQDSRLNGTSIPSQIGNLKALQFLVLRHNNLVGSIPSSLGSLISLIELELYENNLSGNIPAELGFLINLKSLTLSSNVLTGSIPNEISYLTSLGSLNLADNQLSGSIPPHLGNMTSLELLWLQDNMLTGTIPSELQSLNSLQSIELQNNNLSGVIDLDLRSSPHLTDFNVQNTGLTGVVRIYGTCPSKFSGQLGGVACINDGRTIMAPASAPVGATVTLSTTAFVLGGLTLVGLAALGLIWYKKRDRSGFTPARGRNRLVLNAGGKYEIQNDEQELSTIATSSTTSKIPPSSEGRF
ncbi:uncharacterized protein BJ171DRAFT_487109 [Polychytrium aggregatum]|uniref:uncharacterized protein n=1 Tax=Polychytrium aggregatum TaxID=110093 RepID=UPI0022FE5D55|nr:uncharacterized protein BJ171DRAFT_487109 [Polychytrium aggregatum]KAI9209468.1 hypothetical protein BJ171DRAFT_487109 [Polychytrium aggregatum]